MNAWEILGLPLTLELSADELEQQFRTASEGSHPDAGGAAGDFERVREARDVLRDDFLRLEKWLEAHDVKAAHSGVISEEVGAMFGRVNEVTQGVDDWSERGTRVSSGLGKALWQKEGFEWKTRLEALQDEVSAWQERVGGQFGGAQRDGEQGSFEKALALRAELGFLRKWRQELQARFGCLWEGLV